MEFSIVVGGGEIFGLTSRHGLTGSLFRGGNLAADGGGGSDSQ